MTVSDEVTAVGTLRASQSLMLRPEVSGRVAALDVKDGATVRKGQRIVQLDDTLLRAQLAQARAQAAVARTQYRRQQELLAQSFVSRSVVDQSAANWLVAQAQVRTVQAQLAKLRIVAPFDGVLGLWHVSLGDYVKDGADLVTLEDSARLDVDFQLPQRWAKAVEVGHGVRLVMGPSPAASAGATVVHAKVRAVEPALSTEGRSLSVRASLDAPPKDWRPGMFVSVQWVLERREAAMVVPQEAVVTQGRQASVYRIEFPLAAPAPASGQGLQARRVAVETGQRGDGWVEIRSGLTAGDRVVSAGQARLRGELASVRVVEGSDATR